MKINHRALMNGELCYTVAISRIASTMQMTGAEKYLIWILGMGSLIYLKYGLDKNPMQYFSI